MCESRTFSATRLIAMSALGHPLRTDANYMQRKPGNSESFDFSLIPFEQVLCLAVVLAWVLL
jgi:hypothetical protein